MMTNYESYAILSSAQVELLQTLIRQYKLLGSRYTASQLPQLIEQRAHHSQHHGQHEHPADAIDQTSKEHQMVESKPMPVLSWQCFHSLLFYGQTQLPSETGTACSPSVCFFFLFSF
jgi:hypothetical protein